MPFIVLAGLACVLSASCASEQSAPQPTPQAPTQVPHPLPITIAVPGTTAALVLQPVPGGAIEIDAADTTSSANNTSSPTNPSAQVARRIDIAPFHLSTTEITWDMYDAFVFALDRSPTETDPPDAWARPSKPYILMDRGFGHAGYPAISVSYRGATEFCRWLSARTHHRIRLPTELEWEHACSLGTQSPTLLPERAWFADNSEVDMRLSTHPVAQKTPDALGLHDMLGNAAEWTTGPDNKGVAHGGSFRDPASRLTPTSRRPDDRALNASDPQIPKSIWWLADGGFIGFRILLED